MFSIIGGGGTYYSSNDYNVNIIYIGVKVGEDIIIMNLFKMKIDNNILFVMIQTLKDERTLPFKKKVEE